jgi:hypothetical protein
VAWVPLISIRRKLLERTGAENHWPDLCTRFDASRIETLDQTALVLFWPENLALKVVINTRPDL